MADHLSPVERSKNMAAVRSRDTVPEVVVRRVAHSLGFRYRLHVQDLPGSPDLVFPRHKKVIFVHGCFWHRHPHCRYASTPKTRFDWWQKKFSSNLERDKAVIAKLNDAGWRAMIIWQCEIKDSSALRERIVEFLGSENAINKG